METMKLDIAEEEKFKAGLRAMKAFGSGDMAVTDWPGTKDRRAYRYAKLELRTEGTAAAVDLAARLAALGFEVDGYLTMSVFGKTALFHLAISVDFLSDELEEPFSRDITVAQALGEVA